MKTTEEMSFSELVDYWTGQACIGIGSGDFRATIACMLSDTLRVGADRGALQALKAEGKK
jgi:hypothetical protein